MKIIEYILVSLVGLLFFWSFNNESTSKILFIFFATNLSLYYYIFGFAVFNNIPLSKLTKKESYQLIEIKRIVLSIISGWAFSTIIVGIIFKLFDWGFGDTIIIIGLIVNLASLTYSIFKYISNKSPFYLGLIIRGMIYGGFSLSLYLLP